MSTALLDRDERTLAVENAGYRWSYLVLSFGALCISAYRSLVLGENTWDLLGLVIAGGVVNAAYQASGRILSRRWMVVTLVTMGAAAALAAAIVFFASGR